MVECAAKGSSRTPCSSDGPPTRRCGLCGSVAYCSRSHQTSHWAEHKEECRRFQQQMKRADELSDFPFTFYTGVTHLGTRCSFLISQGLHQKGMWRSECSCDQSTVSSYDSWMNDGWSLPCSLTPTSDSKIRVPTCLSSWKDYYEWRGLPFHSPVSLLLHWPLTIYHCFQLGFAQLIGATEKLVIHYLGADKELLQLHAFRELSALFPGIQLEIDFFGPEIPQFKDGERVTLSCYPSCIESSDKYCNCKSSLTDAMLEASSGRTYSLTVHFRKGFYHDVYGAGDQDHPPHFIVALNAGIAAYSSWLPTIMLIKDMRVPAIFTDFCEEAANISSLRIQAVTGRPARLPVQVNPFRQPMPVEDAPLYVPSYSNGFLFAM